MLLQRLESSHDQGSRYAKMVWILSNVVNVKIKNILSFGYSLNSLLVTIFKNMLKHNKSNNEVPFQNRRVEHSGLALTFLA